MRRKWLLAGAISVACAGVGAAWLATVLRRASGEADKAAHQVERQNQFAFRRIALDRQGASGFTHLSASSQFTDAAFFDGKLFLCGPTGLLAFDRDGALVNEYHAGLELPPAPLVRMAAGVGPHLWIATQGAGLLHFDGKTFEQIQPDSPGARALTAVLPLPSGRILLGTERSGVLVWDGTSLSALHPALSGLRVTALAGSEADLWVGTQENGALHWQAGRAQHVSEAEGLPDVRVLSIATEGESAFLGTSVGVAEFRQGRLKRTLAPGVFALALLVRHGSLVIGTLDQGVLELPLEPRAVRPRHGAAGQAEGSIGQLLEADGRLFALAEDGLYEKGRKVAAPPPARLTDRNISAVSMDTAGRLWVGYFDRGLDILEPNGGGRTHLEDERVFCVNRIVHAADGSMTAVASANGLALFDGAGQIRQVLTKAAGLISSNVTDVLLRANGFIVATPAGLSMLEPEGMSSLYAFQGLVNNHVYALAARGPKLLAGTLGGLSILEGGTVRASYTTANSGLKQNWITAIQASGGDWFLGTYGAGVVKLDEAGRWSAFPEFQGRVEINTNAMASTTEAVYAGTLDKGLAVYSRRAGRWHFVVSGLPSANVTALAVDQGQVYVGTDNGMARITEQQAMQ